MYINFGWHLKVGCDNVIACNFQCIIKYNPAVYLCVSSAVWINQLRSNSTCGTKVASVLNFCGLQLRLGPLMIYSDSKKWSVTTVMNDRPRVEDRAAPRWDGRHKL